MRFPFWVINLAFFLFTVLSTLAAGATDRNLPALEALRSGIPYAGTLMAILVCHEMGHYLAARRHKVDASLPYFIPLPIGGIGTLGAVISIRSKLPSLRAILDIGAAGPLAGFVVALPLLVWGFAHSTEVQGVPLQPPNPAFQSPYTYLAAWFHDGRRPADPEFSLLFYGDSIITWLAARLTHGRLPPGTDISIHPVARAAWVGMLVTTMNLTPIGQLDGGHVVYSLFGKWGHFVSRVASHALLGLGIFASLNWLIWWAATRFLVGLRHPAPEDMTPLTHGRRAVAIVSLVILVLTFVPVPISI
ncbi:MAG TPA: site-2 protease family protein [Myxococcales bacterium]